MHSIRLFSTSLCVLLLTACSDEPAADDAETVETPVSAAATAEPGDGCRLSGELYGAIDGEIAWQSADLSCEGMPRPGGAGARLRFAGPHPSGDGVLAVIVALPAHVRDQRAESIDSRVTMIEEGGGRFFAANEAGSCWVDIIDIAALDEDRELTTGRLYCINPLAQVNGSSSLTVPEIEFSGLIDWSAS